MGAFEQTDARALLKRAVDAIGDAQRERGWHAAALGRLADAMDDSARLVADVTPLWRALRERTEAMVRIERDAGEPPEHVVALLKAIVQRAELGTEAQRRVEVSVVQWGIDAYYAA